MTNDQIIAAIFGTEGAYVNDPDDPGGPTKGGVTLAALAEYRGHAVTAEDVQALTPDEIRVILSQNYLAKPGFAMIQNSSLRWAVADASVHSGQGTAAGWLQEIAQVKVDHRFGPVSAAAVNALPARWVLAQFIAHRIDYQGRDIEDHREKAKYAAGWAKRNTRFVRLLGDMP